MIIRVSARNELGRWWAYDERVLELVKALARGKGVTGELKVEFKAKDDCSDELIYDVTGDPTPSGR